MQKKNIGRTLPSIAIVQAEAARVEAMIAATTQRMESTGSDLRAFTHLQLCRAELHAYLAGLLYSLGYSDRKEMVSDIDFSDIQVESTENATIPTREDEDLRYVQLFEC